MARENDEEHRSAVNGTVTTTGDPNDELSSEELLSSPKTTGPWLTVELRTIFILSFVNFLEMTAYAPVEVLQSSLNSEAGLGAVSLACLYGPYFIFAMSAPVIVRFITPKWCIVVSWLCDVLYVSANFYPTWLTLIPASVLTGAMTGSLWTAKDLYVSELASRSVKPHRETYQRKGTGGKYQSVLSYFHGIVFAGISLSLVVGQIISSAILMQSSSAKPDLVCGAFSCQDETLSNLNTTNQTIIVSSRPEKSLVYALLGVLLSLVLLAILVVIVFLPPIPSGNQNHSIKSTLLSCSRRFSDSKMLLMIPQVVLYGFYQATIIADYTKSYITCGAGIGMVGYVMMCWGVTSTLASIVCGRLVKYTGRQIQVVFALLGYTGITVMLWVWIPSEDELALFFIVPAVFGSTDIVFQTHICTIISLMFKDDRASAFANWYTFRALSKAVSFGLSGFVCVWVKLAIASVILTSACVAFVALEIKLKFQKPLTQDDVEVEVKLKSVTKNNTPETET